MTTAPGTGEGLLFSSRSGTFVRRRARPAAELGTCTTAVLPYGLPRREIEGAHESWTTPGRGHVRCTWVLCGRGGSHDIYQAAAFRGEVLLCQRADGSFWVDPSQGCTGGEDPRCADEAACEDSTIVSEGWRHACTWFLFDQEAAPRGEEPFYEGLSPGRGCLGRK
jgi:hypothetical protein